MNYRNVIFIFSLLCFKIDIYSIIFETSNFSEISNYIIPNALVILDIDDTIILPVQTLGTDVWFQERLKLHKAHESDSEIALDKALAEWEAVRHLTKMKIVESGTDKIIQNLQNDSVTIMGLTTQGLALTTRTLNQLKSLNVDLSKTAPSQQDNYFINFSHGVLFHKGILFTAGTGKGTALLKLLELMNFHPEHIIFINDKRSHLEDVENEVIKAHISFTGLRYSYGDVRVANFNPDIAHVQWEKSTFAHILSDDEAVCYLEAYVEGK